MSFQSKVSVGISLLICLIVALGDGFRLFFLPQVYFLPVVWTAVCEGWKAGGGIGAGCGVALLFFSTPEDSETRVIFAAVLVGTGILAGILSDIQRRKSREYQLRCEEMSAVHDKVQASFEGMKRSERLSALGQLSAGLAHEIRNPLASIAGATAILERNKDLNAQDSRCLEIIKKECYRLDGLLTNFLNFARPRPPQFQAVDLNMVLDVVLDLATHGVRGKQIHLVKHIHSPVPLVECDPEQLEQVLLNLMINAVEASPEGETVVLSARQDGTKILIQVADHGHGVQPAHVDRLFDPFFTTKEHGTGLGLPVAHQIVAQMGGRLSAASNPGQGMTFSVMLPTAGME